MKKDLAVIGLGAAVTAAGAVLDIKQMKCKNFNKRDYYNMSGALLLGAGAAHIILGSIDMFME